MASEISKPEPPTTEEIESAKANGVSGSELRRLRAEFADHMVETLREDRADDQDD